MTLEDDVADARVQQEKSRVAALAAFDAWVDEQAQTLSEFLRKEARLTVIDQASVTESITSSIGNLKAAVDAAATKAASDIRTWAASLTEEQKLERVNDISEWARTALYAATSDYRNAFADAGYKVNSGHGWGADNWAFYSSAGGTSRTAYIIPSTSFLDFLTLARAFLSDRAKSASAVEALQKANAAALWGE